MTSYSILTEKRFSTELGLFSNVSVDVDDKKVTLVPDYLAVKLVEV